MSHQNITYKYRINELLRKLNIDEHAKALRVIPAELNISPKTFANYRNIKTNDAQDIPHEKVAMLEKIFGIEPGALLNTAITTKPLKDIRDSDSDPQLSFIDKHGLIKA